MIVFLFVSGYLLAKVIKKWQKGEPSAIFFYYLMVIHGQPQKTLTLQQRNSTGGFVAPLTL